MGELLAGDLHVSKLMFGIECFWMFCHWLTIGIDLSCGVIIRPGEALHPIASSRRLNLQDSAQQRCWHMKSSAASPLQCRRYA